MLTRLGNVANRVADEFGWQASLEVRWMARLTARLAAGRLLRRSGRDAGGRTRRRQLALKLGREVLDLGGQVADHAFQLGDTRLQALASRAARRFLHAGHATKPRPIQLRQFSSRTIHGLHWYQRLFRESVERQVLSQGPAGRADAPLLRRAFSHGRDQQHVLRHAQGSVLEKWADEVPADFRFAIKAPRQITHLQWLKDKDKLLSTLLEVVGTLRERLGPVLFQLPPTAKKDVPRLRAFLALLPPHQRVAFEFRHPSWFDDEVFGLLRDHRVALCIADADDELEVPFVATADWGYLRLRRLDYDDVALKTWANRIKDQHWRDAFVFFKHEEQGNGPRLAQRMIDLTG